MLRCFMAHVQMLRRMTEWVKVVDDPKLLSVLGISSDSDRQGGDSMDT